MDIVGTLPVEVAHEILLQLHPDSVHNAWNTSENWRYLMNTEYFWKRKCKKDNFFLTASTEKSIVFKNLSEKLDPSHAIYTYNQGLNYNWKNNNCYLTSLGDKLLYKTFHFFDDEKIIYTTRNNDLVIMDYATGYIDKTIRLASDEEIEILERQEDFLICVSSHSVYVWNFSSMDWVLFINSVTPIIQLKVYDNSSFAIVDVRGVFSTIDISGIVRNVWNNVYKLVVIYKNLAVLQTGRSEVTILNMEDMSLVTRFACCVEQPIMITMSRANHLICFCRNGNVCTWDIETHTKLLSIDLKDTIRFLDSFKLLEKDRFIYSRYHSKSIEIWDFLAGTCVVKITTNEEINRIVAANDRYIFAMLAFNAGVKVFCSKTGELITTLSSKICYSNGGVALVTESKLVTLRAKEMNEGSLDEIIILDHEKQ